MRTIEIPDQTFEFLTNLSKELKTQDNRCTASPYFFQVREEEEVYVPENCGEYQIWVDGEFILRTEENIKEAVFQFMNWDEDDNSNHHTYDKLSDSDIETILEKMDYRKVDASKRHKYANTFLTEKACEEHIRLNRHNLCNPVSYLSYAHRNPELDTLIKFITNYF